MYLVEGNLQFVIVKAISKIVYSWKPHGIATVA